MNCKPEFTCELKIEGIVVSGVARLLMMSRVCTVPVEDIDVCTSHK